jgi:hypothetical protein
MAQPVDMHRSQPGPARGACHNGGHRATSHHSMRCPGREKHRPDIGLGPPVAQYDTIALPTSAGSGNRSRRPPLEPTTVLRSQEVSSAATCSPGSALGRPANFHLATAGTVSASPAPVTPSACRNRSRDRSAVTISASETGRRRDSSRTNVVTSEHRTLCTVHFAGDAESRRRQSSGRGVDPRPRDRPHCRAVGDQGALQPADPAPRLPRPAPGSPSSSGDCAPD